MKKQILILIVIAILLSYLLFFPQKAFMAASDGLLLWFHTILPSLLPFIILSNFLIATRKIQVILNYTSRFFSFAFGLSVYGTYAMILGLFCGYPMGAKVTGDLYREGLINDNEASYLLTFSNNPSPMFISSFVLGQVLEKTELLPGTLLVLYTATFFTSLFFRIYFHRFHHIPVQTCRVVRETTRDYLNIMDDSIMNGFETITKLGGYIILFSIFASLIGNLIFPFPLINKILPGLIELTTGVVQISRTQLSFPIKYITILMCTSFGGISTILQTKGMLSGTPLSLQLYLFGKIIHTLFTFIFGILFHII